MFSKSAPQLLSNMSFYDIKEMNNMLLPWRVMGTGSEATSKGIVMP